MNFNLWSRPFGSYIFLWMALGLFGLTILLMAGALTSRERDRWVTHTLDVLQNLERYEADILSVRVHLKDSGLLSPSHETDRQATQAGLAMAQQNLEQLLAMTGDNPREGVRIRMLKSLTEQATQRVQGLFQAPVLLGLPSQDVFSDLPITETVSEIRREEQTLLAERRAERASADTLFWTLIGLAVGVNLLIVWWAYSASRRDIIERNRTEAEIRALNARLAERVAAIRDLNQSLEDRVNEKTSQLQSAISKLRTSNYELERFAYVASHDLQEPLRQIASFNNLLALKYGQQFDETAGRYLEYSVAGARRLQLMLRGLLQYSITTPEAVHWTEVQVEQLMHWVLAEMHAEIQSTGARITVEAAPNLTIAGDRDMLRTVVLALVSNSLRFRDPQTAPAVAVVFDRQPHCWSLRVTDNGIGVDERFVPKMFDMFTRFHPIGEFPGVGVGLALSKRIVECHGGEISARPVDSGRGTTLSIEVPISSGESNNPLETGRFLY